MKFIRFFTVIFFIMLLPLVSKAQDITVIAEFDNFESEYLSNRSDDTIYVYNFWATWCKPCVQELPFFDSLNTYRGEIPIKLVLVSLDFDSQIESVLKPFLLNNGIQNEVVVLTDGKVNSWINKVDSSWSGAIPATLILKGNEKLFYEQTFHSYQSIISSILKIIL